MLVGHIVVFPADLMLASVRQSAWSTALLCRTSEVRFLIICGFCTDIMDIAVVLSNETHHIKGFTEISFITGQTTGVGPPRPPMEKNISRDQQPLPIWGRTERGGDQSGKKDFDRSPPSSAVRCSWNSGRSETPASTNDTAVRWTNSIDLTAKLFGLEAELE